MNSIHRDPPQINHADLAGKDAIAKIQEIVHAVKTCFFCTAVATTGSHAARPMSVQQVDEAGNLWFLSALDSHKDEEVAVEPTVRLYFQGSSHSEFLLLEGSVSVSRDRKKIDELWDPIINTWFPQGKDDPRITVIKFTPADGYYWDTKHGSFVAGTKMLVETAPQETREDSVEGKLLV